MGPETGVLDLESSAVTVLSTIKLKRREVVASTRATVETWWPNGLYTRLNIEGGREGGALARDIFFLGKTLFKI